MNLERTPAVKPNLKSKTLCPRYVTWPFTPGNILTIRFDHFIKDKTMQIKRSHQDNNEHSLT